jgi:hypothetical protein
MLIGDRDTHTRSTRTADAKAAIERAEDFWGDCKLWQRGGPEHFPESLRRIDTSRRFDRVADSWLAELEREAGSDSRRLRNLKDTKHSYLARNGLAAFFGKDDVDSITTDRIKAFLAFQVENSLKGSLAPATQKRTLVTLNLILKHAYQARLINQLPLMPRVKLKQEPRGWFRKEEYRLLYTTAWRLAHQARTEGDHKAFESWMEMGDFIIFMVSTFLRPSEWADLRHRHVTVHDAGYRYLELGVINGKTGRRPVISMPRAAAVYDRIIERHGDDPDGYLFKPHYANRQTAKERMRDQFAVLLKETGLKRDGLDKVRPLYSLRHTALMYRALYGEVDKLVLARNAGTSIDQLEKFYLSHITAGMKRESLHSRKPVRRKKRPL